MISVNCDDDDDDDDDDVDDNVSAVTYYVIVSRVLQCCLGQRRTSVCLNGFFRGPR